MNDVIAQWAQRWGVDPAAADDLFLLIGRSSVVSGTCDGESESHAQAACRLDAAEKGTILYRNNSGALQDAGGRYVRYGLCNDSKRLNKSIKSSDLIGIAPVRILPEHVGCWMGQFTAREMKAPGWVFSGTPEEVAQQKFITIINRLGGNACFATGAGTIADRR